jgi:hypothetical protein
MRADDQFVALCLPGVLRHRLEGMYMVSVSLHSKRLQIITAQSDMKGNDAVLIALS